MLSVLRTFYQQQKYNNQSNEKTKIKTNHCTKKEFATR